MAIEMAVPLVNCAVALTADCLENVQVVDLAGYLGLAMVGEKVDKLAI